MPERVTVLEDLGVIRVDCSGEVDEDILLVSMEAMLKLRRERGLTKVFVDATRQTVVPPIFQLHRAMVQLSQRAQDMKHAVATSPSSKQELKYTETVGQNRGMHMQVFDSADAALAWLAE